MQHLWGLDLGGTKIEGVIIDPNAPDRPICRLRLPTESEKGYEHIRSQIAKVVKMISSESGLPLPKRIGMGTPGVIDPRTSKLKNSNTQCLNGQRLRDDVATDLGIEVATANDANCFALAEATLGAARRFPTVFGIIMGTGVGGGIVVNGQVLEGCHGIAGEWGQIVLDPSGPPSNYGTHGTVEALIAGPALLRGAIGPEAQTEGNCRARGNAERSTRSSHRRAVNRLFRAVHRADHRRA
jgi:fructokinase